MKFTGNALTYNRTQILLSTLTIIISSAAAFFLFSLDRGKESGAIDTIFLSGWGGVNQDYGQVVSSGATSSIAFLVQKKDSYKLDFDIYFHKPGRNIAVYFNEGRIKTLNEGNIDKWSAISIIIPGRLFKTGYNRLIFSELSNQSLQTSFKNFKLAAYKHKGVAGGISIYFFVIAMIWVVYSFLFSRLVKIGYLMALRIDSLSYLAGAFASMLLFLACALSKQWFLKKDNFVAIAVTVTCLYKVMSLLKYSGRKTLKYSNNWAKLLPPYVIASALAFIYFIFAFLAGALSAFNAELILNLILAFLVILGMIKLIQVKG